MVIEGEIGNCKVYIFILKMINYLVSDIIVKEEEIAKLIKVDKRKLQEEIDQV